MLPANSRFDFCRPISRSQNLRWGSHADHPTGNSQATLKWGKNLVKKPSCRTLIRRPRAQDLCGWSGGHGAMRSKGGAIRASVPGLKTLSSPLLLPAHASGPVPNMFSKQHNRPRTCARGLCSIGGAPGESAPYRPTIRACVPWSTWREAAHGSRATGRSQVGGARHESCGCVIQQLAASRS